MRNLLVFSFVILSALYSYANGGWVSGGSELFKDALNPWFLNNISDVYYCIKIDNQNFGVKEDVVEKNLILAVSYWQEEFKRAHLTKSKRLGNVKIASQNFVKTDCSDKKLDVSFQFGYLNSEQKIYLGNPKRFAAVSVRTEYDLKKLKAKGFVYVSPAYGDLAYNSEGVIKNAWARDNGNLLYLALVHELGHVFGLSHYGSLGSLMSEGFLETMLSSTHIPNRKEMSLNFFTLPNEKIICPQEVLLKVWQGFFDLEIGEKCLKLQFDHKPENQLFGLTNLKIFSVTVDYQVIRKIKDIDLQMYRFNPVAANLIWLSTEQEIFQKDEYITGLQGVLGFSLVSVAKKGFFISNKNSAKRLVTIKFEQGKAIIAIEGITENGDILTLL